MAIPIKVEGSVLTWDQIKELYLIALEHGYEFSMDFGFEVNNITASIPTVNTSNSKFITEPIDIQTRSEVGKHYKEKYGEED